MATYEIGILPSVADQRLKVVLDGETFILRARWNASAGQWMLDVEDAAGVILAGIPMTLAMPYLRRYADRRLPRGELLIIDTSAQDLEAGLDDLGARVKLLYIEAADLPVR